MGKELAYLTKRKKYDLIQVQLENERVTWRPYWRDLSKFILPRRSRFFTTDFNRGDRRNTAIIDSSATLAVRTLASGMMTGITSPARSWFKLDTTDDELNDIPPVRDFLDTVTKKMRSIFLKSNLYNVLPTLYGDLGTFGTACIYMEEDEKDVIRFNSFPLGSFFISNDERGRVNVIIREFQMSVRQIVEKFGMTEPGRADSIDWTNISDIVKEQWILGNFETYVDVCHIVLPNDEYDDRKIESKYKKFKSVYYEKGINNPSQNNVSITSMPEPEKFLSEKGYDFFPALVVRWELTGEDTYGSNCPGMVCIGDVKQLQLGEKRIAQALDQKVRPSMIGPTSLRSAKASILPGDITYLDEREGTKGFRRLFELDFDIRELEVKQEQVRQRISRAFYEDLFLMLANSTRREITAREVEERHEEKLLALGPVLERINQDLLDPLIENTFEIMGRRNLLPEIPEQLADQDYKIEYVSIMAQAQKLAGIGNLERFLGFVGQTASFDPSITQKIDLDEAVEAYADYVGVSPKILKTKEEMERLRAEQQAAAQQQQQLEAAGQLAQVGKTMADTEITEESALQQLMGGELG